MDGSLKINLSVCVKTALMCAMCEEKLFLGG